MTPSQYRGIRDKDGTLTVYAVPIFVECSRGETTFDQDWIQAAVAKAEQRQAEGYFAPLHIRHHEPATEANQSVRAAGYFEITGTQTITFKGQSALAIMADLKVTDPMVQDEILSKRLPYRSVEIFDVNDPSIDSLALLDHEAPYLELPMLMVSMLQDNSPEGRPMFSSTFRVEHPESESSSPVAACFRRGHSAFLIIQEADMAPKKKATTKAEETDPKKMACEPKGENMQEETKDEEKSEDMEAGEGGGVDVDSVCKAIESGEISIADFDKILASIAKAKGESEVEEEPAEEMPAPAPVPSSDAMKAASLEGEVAALKARMEDRDAQDARKSDVSEAMQRLENYPLGAEPEKALTDFHKEHGPEAFKAYVDSMAKTFAAVETIDDFAASRFASQGNKTDAVVMKYAAHGTDAMAKAQEYSAEWEQLRLAGYRRSKESYVDGSMKRLGLDPAQ